MKMCGKISAKFSQNMENSMNAVTFIFWRLNFHLVRDKQETLSTCFFLLNHLAIYKNKSIDIR